MPDTVAERFDARLPLLEHVARALEAEIRDTLSPSILVHGAVRRVLFEVMSKEDFLRAAESLAHPNDALVNIDNQVVGFVRVSDDDLERCESTLRDCITIIAASQQTTQKGEDTHKAVVRRFVCLIPPQVRPPGWVNRGDVPRTFTIEMRGGSPPPSTNPSVDALVPNGRPVQPRALIMKGGGIKGLAYVGALELLSQHYTFGWYVGTSAGAIAAVLLGAGYSVEELKQILQSKNFRDFFDAPLYKAPTNLAFHRGCFPGEAFTAWLDVLLAQKLGKRTRVTLGDLPARVTVYASRRDTRAIEFDSVDTGDIAAAYAVRCSMSIPIVFFPQAEQGLSTYDGGLQNNFPIEELLRNHPGTEFIALYLGPEVYEPPKKTWVIRDLLSIWTESSDPLLLDTYGDRIVCIDPRPVGTLDFGLTNTEKDFLLACGRVGALAHLDFGSSTLGKERQRRDAVRAMVVGERTARKRRRKLWIVAILTTITLGWALFRWW